MNGYEIAIICGCLSAILGGLTVFLCVHQMKKKKNDQKDAKKSE
jgi:hypothetical protein